MSDPETDNARALTHSILQRLGSYIPHEHYNDFARDLYELLAEWKTDKAQEDQGDET